MRQTVLTILITFLLVDSFAQTVDTSEYFDRLTDTIKLTTVTPQHIKSFSRTDKQVLDTVSIPNAIIYRQDSSDGNSTIKIAIKGQTDWTTWTLYRFEWDDHRASGGNHHGKFSFRKEKMCDNCAELLIIDFDATGGHQSYEAGWSEYYGSMTVWDINKQTFYFHLITKLDFEEWAYGTVDTTNYYIQDKKVEDIKPVYNIKFGQNIISIQEYLIIVRQSGRREDKKGSTYKYKLLSGQLIRQK